MKICPKCKKIYDESEVTCSDCRKKLKNIENKNTPVGVCKVSGVDRMRVHAALEDAGIPSGEQRVKSKVSAEAITGGDLSDVIITVPYQAYDKALDICIGIGVVDDDTIDEKTKEDIESKKEQYDKDIEEFEEKNTCKDCFCIITYFNFLPIYLGSRLANWFYQNIVLSVRGKNEIN